MAKQIENTVLSRIYGNGRGWVFSQRDFSHLGSRSAIDVSLHRLWKKGKIRRVLRGLYDYPRFSTLLDQKLSPNLDQAAQALARKFAWSIQPSGPAALNLMGLSTQVPGRFLYLSNGPSRSYKVGNIYLSFEHTASKDAGFKLRESALIVQGLKSLGKDHLSPEVIQEIQDWLNPTLRPRVLKDTQTATGWVYEAIRQICEEHVLV